MARCKECGKELQTNPVYDNGFCSLMCEADYNDYGDDEYDDFVADPYSYPEPYDDGGW